jgi:putative lipoprotein
MRRSRLSAFVAGLITLASMLFMMPGATQAQTNAVTGTAGIRQRISLPANAVVTIQLADVSRVGAAAQVISEQRFQTNGAQAPFSFNLPYDPAKVVPNGTYTVQGNVTIDGRLRYTTTTQFRVLTNGAPSSTNITLEAVQLPNTGSGYNLLGLSALLLIGFVVVYLLRTRLAR